jgi:hypothetical protein
MLQEPNVEVLAGHMQAIIDQSLLHEDSEQHAAMVTVP